MKDFYENGHCLCRNHQRIYGKKCDLYFTNGNKLRRLLKCCFTLYKVPEAKQEEVIGQILKMDLKPIAEKIIEDTVRKAEEGFEAVLAEK